MDKKANEMNEVRGALILAAREPLARTMLALGAEAFAEVKKLKAEVKKLKAENKALKAKVVPDYGPAELAVLAGGRAARGDAK